ncbi:asparagine synthase-related protein [Novosphingobium percolationis]|uniref:asparagine synthase-related protein n=1 Tax=Novosphingobium percolationis TaxID=2871811 RepID=UPI001CD43A91|nr:asparagine synthetase B family protein [Novosphingobium percolationis]
MTRERYLAIVGHGARPLPSALVDRITARFDAIGLVRTAIGNGLVIYSDRTLPIIAGKHVVVVGQVFGSTAPLSLEAIDASHLTTQCWGNYLAFGLSPDGPVGWVLRAPMGHLPALRTQTDELTILASGADLLVDALEIVPRIDWAFCATHIACQHFVTSTTGIEGIDELLGGECFQREADGTWQRQTVWSPWQWTTIDREIGDFEEAARTLRSRVEDAVRCLTENGGPYLLELSGGVDSSVLAAALAAAGTKARAATLVTGTAEGDERHYARASARATGLTLDELQIRGAFDLTGTTQGRLARPGLPVALAQADDALAAQGRSAGITAFVSGSGGDCVLCSAVSAAPAVDAIRRCGIGETAWNTIDALARIHHTNIWSVARMAWQQARSGPLHSRWQIVPGLLAADRVPATAPEHPWFDEPAHVLPGKRSHVRGVLASLAHVDGFGRHTVAPSRFPLLSQPVVETAMRIPSWLWVSEGRDRAVARHAWRDILPPVVLERRTKGGLDTYAIEAVIRSRSDLHSFLLEGHLAANEVIDRQKVDAALNRPVRRTDPAAYQLLQLADVETWARAWIGPP